MNYYHPKFDLEPASQPVDLEEAQAFRYKAFGVVNESGLDRDEYDKKFNRVQKFNNVNKNYLIFFINKFLNSSTATVAGLCIEKLN